MNCDYTEKISLLIDGELSESDAKEATAHLAACDICQRAHRDFLRVRDEIKAYVSQPDFIAQRRALRRILTTEKSPLWKRRIALPAPVFALLLLALIALGVWTATIRRAAQVVAERRPGKVVTVPATDSKSETDLARFDRGGRAAIYKVRRAEPDETEP